MEYWTKAPLLLYCSKSGDEEKKFFSVNIRKELFKEKYANEECSSDKIKIWPSQKQKRMAALVFSGLIQRTTDLRQSSSVKENKQQKAILNCHNERN